jgi:RNA polymerase sigma-70 factor (ECF subfamily)
MTRSIRVKAGSQRPPGQGLTTPVGEAGRHDLICSPVLGEISAVVPSPHSHEIEEAWTRSRQTWPDIELDLTAYAAFVDERAAGASLDELYLDHLYLACACAEGVPHAIARVEERFVGRLGAALAPFEQVGIAAAEVVQLLRVRLFTCEEGRRPRIAEYGGLADLGAWIKVVAVRIAISLGRKDRRELAVGDEMLGQVPSQTPSPELALLRETYRSEFRAAFQVGFRSLTPRERNLLRHQVLDQMSIDRIGALYGVHRATAARWLAHARHALVRAVRRELQSQLQVGRSELESILRLIQSQLDISLRAFLSRT